MTPEIVLNYLGLLGAGVYVAAYFLLQSGIVGGNSIQYTLMNLTASSLVLMSLYASFNAASAVIQSCWVVISIYGMTRMYLIYRRISFTGDERQFIDDKFAYLQKHLARRVLNLGVWIEAEAGTELTVAAPDGPRPARVRDGFWI